MCLPVLPVPVLPTLTAMERKGIGVEVLGVPSILPDDRIVDKLTIHFLRPRHGGGEVQRVLYPSYLPGQALVIFEDPAGM